MKNSKTILRKSQLHQILSGIMYRIAENDFNNCSFEMIQSKYNPVHTVQQASVIAQNNNNAKYQIEFSLRNSNPNYYEKCNSNFVGYINRNNKFSVKLHPAYSTTSINGKIKGICTKFTSNKILLKGKLTSANNLINYIWIELSKPDSLFSPINSTNVLLSDNLKSHQDASINIITTAIHSESELFTANLISSDQIFAQFNEDVLFYLL